ncbi:TetR family transcriptional regulator [Gordonia sinesedis]
MTTRQTFAEASKRLLRTTLLDGLHDLLADRDWSAVTMADVARISGVSRQTVYNEFGSRNGLAQAYALRLAVNFTHLVTAAIDANVDDVDKALHDGFAAFFTEAGADPLITSLQSGDAKPDLLKLITTDAGPIITTASDGLTRALTESWIKLPAEDAERIARSVARIALSYVSMPPETDRDVAADLAAVMAPAVLAAQVGR